MRRAALGGSRWYSPGLNLHDVRRLRGRRRGEHAEQRDQHEDARHRPACRAANSWAFTRYERPAGTRVSVLLAVVDRDAALADVGAGPVAAVTRHLAWRPGAVVIAAPPITRKRPLAVVAVRLRTVLRERPLIGPERLVRAHAASAPGADCRTRSVATDALVPRLARCWRIWKMPADSFGKRRLGAAAVELGRHRHSCPCACRSVEPTGTDAWPLERTKPASACLSARADGNFTYILAGQDVEVSRAAPAIGSSVPGWPTLGAGVADAVRVGVGLADARDRRAVVARVGHAVTVGALGAAGAGALRAAAPAAGLPSTCRYAAGVASSVPGSDRASRP